MTWWLHMLIKRFLLLWARLIVPYIHAMGRINIRTKRSDIIAYRSEWIFYHLNGAVNRVFSRVNPSGKSQRAKHCYFVSELLLQTAPCATSQFFFGNIGDSDSDSQNNRLSLPTSWLIDEWNMINRREKTRKELAVRQFCVAPSSLLIICRLGFIESSLMLFCWCKYSIKQSVQLMSYHICVQQSIVLNVVCQLDKFYHGKARLALSLGMDSTAAGTMSTMQLSAVCDSRRYFLVIENSVQSMNDEKGLSEVESSANIEKELLIDL